MTIIEKAITLFVIAFFFIWSYPLYIEGHGKNDLDYLLKAMENL